MWRSLPADTRAALEALHKEGKPTPEGVMEGKPELLPWAEDIYVRFYEIDRDMNGGITFQGRCAVLDEYGVTDPFWRQWEHDTFRLMEAHRREVAEEHKSNG